MRFTASVLLFKVEHLPASYPGYCEHFDVSLMVFDIFASFFCLTTERDADESLQITAIIVIIGTFSAIRAKLCF